MELNAGYSRTKSDSDRILQVNNLTASSNTNDNYSITASPGINVFINKDLSLTSRIGRLGYSNSTDTYNNSNGDTGTSIRDSVVANISLNSFYFGVLYRI